jgi:hypothetical protein
MKIKQDFVTNSSSTSYLISCSKPLLIEKESIIHDLFKSILKHFDVINTVEELTEYWEDQYGNIEEIPEYYNKCLEVINNGGSIISANIDYGTETDFPNNFISKHGGKIIMGD